MSNFLTLDDVDVAGRRVILRGDLNVPLAHGQVSDRTRIERLAPTLLELIKKKARVVVLSHFGRPKGKPDPAFSLRPVVPALAESLGQEIAFAENCVGDAAEATVNALKDGEIALLENLRFHEGETRNDPDFAAALARLGEIYINDAFAAAHRAHASIDALARRLPAYAGRLVEAEVKALHQAVDAPTRPVAAIVGGAKVSTKLKVLESLLQRMDFLVIGGAMANTFLLAMGRKVGTSLVETDLVETAREVMEKAQQGTCRLILPKDVVVAPTLSADAASRTVPASEVPDDQMILDIGPESVAALVESLEGMKTVLWNGPLGAFETPPFDTATVTLARAVARGTREGRLISVAGGGDTIAALSHAGAIDDFTYVSTAGGAFLEWLEGANLPGIAALEAYAAKRSAKNAR